MGTRRRDDESERKGMQTGSGSSGGLGGAGRRHDMRVHPKISRATTDHAVATKQSLTLKPALLQNSGGAAV